MNPYFDGITCIVCLNQFNVDTRFCTDEPKDQVYSKNSKFYVTPEVNKETNPGAMYYTSSKPLRDTKLGNCNVSHPYYDGTSCIVCQKPFTIFDTDKK